MMLSGGVCHQDLRTAVSLQPSSVSLKRDQSKSEPAVLKDGRHCPVKQRCTLNTERPETDTRASFCYCSCLFLESGFLTPI